jgi:hypothetical protein
VLTLRAAARPQDVESNVCELTKGSDNMTQPAEPWLVTIPQLKDRLSLQLVSRLIESQITVMEAQVNQLQQVRKLVEEQMKNVG